MLEALYLSWVFICIHTLYMRAANALTRLRLCAVSSEHSLLVYAISAILSCTGTFLLQAISNGMFPKVDIKLWIDKDPAE